MAVLQPRFTVMGLVLVEIILMFVVRSKTKALPIVLIVLSIVYVSVKLFQGRLLHLHDCSVICVIVETSSGCLRLGLEVPPLL